MQPSLFDDVAVLAAPASREDANAFAQLRADAARVSKEEEHNVFRGEFWTAKQRDGHPLHEISYRACFKPQLAEFCIERFSRQGEVVYDPFMGRGTTVLEAALCGRVGLGNDLNPVCARLIEPRLRPPRALDVRKRLDEFEFEMAPLENEGLLAFYHPRTLAEIEAWRRYFGERRRKGEFDSADGWIEMVACSRLSGHSPGFFSVYTLPPNQAVSVASQQKINARREQTPPQRDTRALIWRKTQQLLRSSSIPFLLPHKVTTGCATQTNHIAPHSIDLIVTSPPFLNVVDYRADNWLRAWFLRIELEPVALWQTPKPAEWQSLMAQAFAAWHSILKPKGALVVEVGEVNEGKVALEELICEAGRDTGWQVEAVLINSQHFTKTANCWGVNNMSKGTNSNRLVVFSRVCE